MNPFCLDGPARTLSVALGCLVYTATAATGEVEPVPPAAMSACGPVAIPGHYGPYDYISERGRLAIVEQYHFTAKVEALIAGESGALGGDLSYTLNAAPNHLRALVAAMNYAARTKAARPPGMDMSVECYFDRAVRFRPDDASVRALFALYLARLNRMPEAERQLEAAVHFAGDNGLSQHNIGLTYLELGLVDRALGQAHLARRLGFEGTLLSDKLKAAKRWKEPE
jgi:tetratricopeptide (TPR) repeat protein